MAVRCWDGRRGGEISGGLRLQERPGSESWEIEGGKCEMEKERWLLRGGWFLWKWI